MAKRPRNKRKQKPTVVQDPESRGRVTKVRKRSGSTCTTRNRKPLPGN